MKVTVGLRCGESKEDDVSLSLNLPDDKVALLKSSSRAVAIATQAIQRIINEIHPISDDKEE